MPKPYRPSNGTEGEIFMDRWCYSCAALNICKILPATMAYDADHPRYPKQWTYNEQSDPVCTSFRDKASVKRGPATRCSETPEMFGGGK